MCTAKLSWKLSSIVILINGTYIKWQWICSTHFVSYEITFNLFRVIWYSVPSKDGTISRDTMVYDAKSGRCQRRNCKKSRQLYSSHQHRKLMLSGFPIQTVNKLKVDRNKIHSSGSVNIVTHRFIHSMNVYELFLKRISKRCII